MDPRILDRAPDDLGKLPADLPVDPGVFNTVLSHSFYLSMTMSVTVRQERFPAG